MDSRDNDSEEVEKEEIMYNTNHYFTIFQTYPEV